MGSDLIVAATMLFLLLSAVVLILMLYTMRHPQKILTITAHAETLPKGFRSPRYAAVNTARLDDIQDFINAKAEILYNGNAYAINSDSYQIGRDKSCNLAVSEKGVSRVHCKIAYSENRFTLCDLLSSNGTYINGQRVANAVELHNGDEIGIGYAVMEFKRRNEPKTNNDGAESPSQRTE